MNHYRVKPDQAVNLHDHDANDTGDYKNKEEAAERTEHLRQKLDALQELLYAERNRAVLVVLQGIDTAGKDGKKRRLLERLDNADKHWKFSLQDLKERGYWDAYQKAFEEALSATSTAESPWFVVPANHKWYRNLVVAENLVHALKDMDPQLAKGPDIDWKKRRHDVSET